VKSQEDLWRRVQDGASTAETRMRENTYSEFSQRPFKWAQISVRPLLKSERLSAKSKLTLYKALIRYKMTYACPAWEFVADSHLLKLQCLQN
jgi:transposase